MKRKANLRIFSVFLVITLVFALTCANVFVVTVLGWHINSAQDIRNEVKGMYVVNEELLAKRGNILDRNGTILAQDVIAYTLYANIDPERFESDKTTPAHVVDKEAASKIIASVIGSEVESVLSILNTENVKQVEFGSKGKYLTLSQKQTLENEKIPGLGFKEIIKRDYSNDLLASTLIGRSVFEEDNETQKGIMGIEQYYNDILTGENGLSVYRKDSTNDRFEDFKELSKDATDGKTIVLTIDKGIQEELENALQQMLDAEGVKASEAWGAVMNVKTGEIVAFADRPAFNANDPNTTYLNRGSQYQYEPGSTMKTFTVASAIDRGLLGPDDTFDSKPFYLGMDANGNAIRVTKNDRHIAVINNAGFIDYGVISYYLGYQVSSNVGLSEIIVNKLDPEKYREDLEALGFFKKVDADRIPNEPGQLLWNNVHEKVTSSFGQGSTVTMLQLLQGYSAIFGDGTAIKPYFVKQIIDTNTNKVEYEAQKQTLAKVYKESTVQTMRDLMYDNVDHVELTRFRMDNVKVMAKTGTAQIVIDGAYSKSRYIYSAAMGFPYEDPEFMVYFAYQTVYHDSRITAGYIKTLINKIVATYPTNGNAGEYVPSGKTFTMDNAINLSVSDAKDRFEARGVHPIILGKGSTVLNQYPKDGQTYLGSDKVLLFTSSEALQMPDMTGWSIKEVRAFAEIASIDIVITGSGYVKQQPIPKDTVLEKNQKIEINLE